MNELVERVRRFAPLALPLVIVAAGWFTLIGPALTASTQASRQVDSLRQRLDRARAALVDPPPPVSTVDPVAAFNSRVVAGDASSRVVLQLATLAQRAQAANLDLVTGTRVAMSGGSGPQASGAAASPDPRLQLFGAALAYTPITMTFDAQYASVGEFMWALRDLPTTIEIRSVEIRPRAAGGEASAATAAGDTRVHVSLTVFAYAREARNEA